MKQAGLCIPNLAQFSTPSQHLTLLSAHRVPELAVLLNPDTQFPSAPWTGTNLALLSPLGLRSSVTPETILKAARYVEALAASDENDAYQRCVWCFRINCKEM